MQSHTILRLAWYPLQCGNCFAPSQIWFNEIGTNLHVFSGGRYQNMGVNFHCFFFSHTIFLCETALFGNDQITKQYKVTPCYDLLGTHCVGRKVTVLGTHGVELLLHLAEHGLMKLVPIYMF